MVRVFALEGADRTVVSFDEQALFVKTWSRVSRPTVVTGAVFNSCTVVTQRDAFEQVQQSAAFPVIHIFCWLTSFIFIIRIDHVLV